MARTHPPRRAGRNNGPARQFETARRQESKRTNGDKTGNGETMVTPHPSLRMVSERFGPLTDRTFGAFERDPDFRDLCDEYQACAKTLAAHEESHRASEAMRREYAALLLRVERELLRYLDEHPDG